MSTEEDDDLGIKPGETVIDSGKANYKVICLLGEGGFGAVYKVYAEPEKSKEFAMKVEKKLETRKHSKLKMEIAILKLVATMRNPDRSHFTKIVDRGKKPTYFFLVMQLVGKSLADLKNARSEKVFSIGTGLGCGVQCLEAVEDLHQQGYIHRDLKPANYACGLEKQKHVIYILDFGIARKIMKNPEELKTPRLSVGFKGTVRFASLACHRNQELSKKDDCESWFYLLCDLMVSSGLPWRKQTDKGVVLRTKETCRTPDGQEEMFRNLPCKKEFGRIIEYIDGLQYVENPDYQFIYNMCRKAADVAGTDMDGPYDWEDEAPKTNRSKAPAVTK